MPWGDCLKHWNNRFLCFIFPFYNKTRVIISGDHPKVINTHESNLYVPLHQSLCCSQFLAVWSIPTTDLHSTKHGDSKASSSHIDGLVQDCSISSALTILLQDQYQYPQLKQLLSQHADYINISCLKIYFPWQSAEQEWNISQHTCPNDNDNIQYL